MKARWLAIAIALLAPDALAQGNYRSTPIGGRSALMGSTGIALARDGSSAFLNPATIAAIDDSSVAFSVNFYTFTNTYLRGFHQPGPVDKNVFGDLKLGSTELQQGRFDALPSSLCVFLALGKEDAGPHRKGRKKLAGCLANIERREINVTAIAYHGAFGGLTTDQAQSFEQKWNRLHVGPTYGVYVTDDVALGVSVHAIDTTTTNVWTSSAMTVDGSGRSISSDLDVAGSGHSIDVGAILGATWHMDRYHTLGLSISTPTVHVNGSYDATRHAQFSGAGEFGSVVTATGDLDAPPPVRIGAGLGAAYGKLRLEVDATYYFPRAEAVRADLRVHAAPSRDFDASFVERADGIANAAFGVEYLATPRIGILGGMSTDFSAAPPLTTPNLGTTHFSRAHRVAGSLGIGSYGRGGELLFGTEVSYAWGHAYAVNNYVLPAEFAVVDQSAVKILLVVAGSTSLSTLKRTVDSLGDIVKPR